MKPQLRDHTEPDRPRRVDQPLVARRRPADRRTTATPHKHSIRNRIASAVSVLLLAGLTVVVVRETVTPIATPIEVAASATPDGHHDGGHAPPGRTPTAPNPDPALFDAATTSAELPPGGEFTARGSKKWMVVPGTAPAIGGQNRITYTVEVEEGIQLTGGPEGFAADVTGILADPRGWIGDGQHGFERVDSSGEPDLRIRLTSQLTTREVCGYSIPLEGSCATTDVVTINVARWVRGAVSFQGALVEYKQYVINHEVGHGLGYDHKPCQESGALAPVMMQQSWGISNDYLAALGTDRVVADGKVCRPNAWPYPTGSR